MSTPLAPSYDPRRSNAPELRWYAPITGVLNLVLLLQVVQRFHHAATPLNHGVARVLATALAVNIAGALAILWLASIRRWSTGLGAIVKLDVLISLLPFGMAALRHDDNARVFHLFATVYVTFLLARAAELLFYAAKNAASTGVRIGSIVFAAVFLVYGGVSPWMALAISPQGDEPHFLILTYSLVNDHDFEVGNNYDNGDYGKLWPPPAPGAVRGYPYASIERDNLVYLPHEPHVVLNPRGQRMLQHDPGFPILVLPGYAMDGREGTLFTMALVGAAGAAAIFEIAALLEAGIPCALLTVVLFCFSTPYWVFTQSALSDLCGAVGILWVVLQFFRYRVRERNRYLVLAGIVIAVLPWMNIRWWSLAGPAFLVLCAWILKRSWGNWPGLLARLSCLVVPPLLGLVGFSALDKHLYNSYLPNESMLLLGHNMPQFELHPMHGLLGMLFDQSYGLIPTGPLYVAVAAGMLVLFRRDRWGFAMLLLPALGYLPFIAFSQYWFGGWNAPARYVISGVAPMIPAAALVLTRRVRWAVALLGAWSLFVGFLFTVNPFLRIPSIWVLYKMSMLVEFFHDHVRTPFYSIFSIFPNMMFARPQDWMRGWAWLALFIAAAWAWARSVPRTPLKRDAAE